MHKLINNQLWFFKTPKSPGVLIANRVPSSIKDPNIALDWAADMGRNGYDELIALAEDYKEKAEQFSDPDIQKIYSDLEIEARERAEMEL